MSVGWLEAEALRALRTTLDDDSLAAFKAIPEADRETLPRAYAQMTAIFDPPSNARRFFAADAGGGELSVALSITEEDDLTSLKVAQCIQVYLSLQQWPTVAAPKEMERACASFVRGPRERGVKGLQPEQEWCWRDSLPAWGSATTCFKYGQQGHIARGLPEQRRIIRIIFYGFCPAGIRFPGLTGKSRHIRHSAAIVISRISVAAQVQSTRHHPSSRCGTRAVVSGVEWVAVLRKPME
ncbi:unnamed protein product [Lampetra fluviatilis]